MSTTAELLQERQRIEQAERARIEAENANQRQLAALDEQIAESKRQDAQRELESITERLAAATGNLEAQNRQIAQEIGEYAALLGEKTSSYERAVEAWREYQDMVTSAAQRYANAMNGAFPFPGRAIDQLSHEEQTQLEQHNLAWQQHYYKGMQIFAEKHAAKHIEHPAISLKRAIARAEGPQHRILQAVTAALTGQWLDVKPDYDPAIDAQNFERQYRQRR